MLKKTLEDIRNLDKESFIKKYNSHPHFEIASLLSQRVYDDYCYQGLTDLDMLKTYLEVITRPMGNLDFLYLMNLLTPCERIGHAGGYFESLRPPFVLNLILRDINAFINIDTQDRNRQIEALDVTFDLIKWMMRRPRGRVLLWDNFDQKNKNSLSVLSLFETLVETTEMYGLYQKILRYAEIENFDWKTSRKFVINAKIKMFDVLKSKIEEEFKLHLKYGIKLKLCIRQIHPHEHIVLLFHYLTDDLSVMEVRVDLNTIKGMAEPFDVLSGNDINDFDLQLRRAEGVFSYILSEAFKDTEFSFTYPRIRSFPASRSKFDLPVDKISTLFDAYVVE